MENFNGRPNMVSQRAGNKPTRGLENYGKPKVPRKIPSYWTLFKQRFPELKGMVRDETTELMVKSFFNNDDNFTISLEDWRTLYNKRSDL